MTCAWCGETIPTMPTCYVIDGKVDGHVFELRIEVEEHGRVVPLCVDCYDIACQSTAPWGPVTRGAA